MKNKINYLEFKKSLELTGKTFFSFSDLQKFYPTETKSLKSLLSSWSKKKLIINLTRGWYSFDLVNLNYLNLACQIVPNSYISFESALSIHGLINQVPSVITLATKSRGRTIQVVTWVFEYTHLKPNLIFDYEIHDKYYLASKEKALADLAYLISRGKRIVELDTLDKNKIDKSYLKEVLKNFPSYTFKKAQELILV